MKKFLTIISVIVLAFGAITIATASTSEDEKANAYIECSTPDFVLGTMSLENFGRIYDMLPSSFQEAMVSYFQDVTDEAEGKSRFSAAERDFTLKVRSELTVFRQRPQIRSFGKILKAVIRVSFTVCSRKQTRKLP